MKNIFEIFKKRIETVTKLPFVHLFGYEKSYGKPSPHDHTKMVNEYKSWAYACALKNGFSVAKVPLRLYTKKFVKDEEQLVEIKKHPLIDLLKNVNPSSNKFELLTLTQIYQELTGNAYWWMPRDAFGVPQSIWIIPSHWMKIVPDEQEFIAGYVAYVPGKGSPIPFNKEEIVHFKFPSPFDLHYGAGPLFAAAYGIDLNNEIKTWGINFFMNNANPGGVLYTEQSLTPDIFQRLRDNWNIKHRGSSNAGKMAILEGGLKYQQIGSSLKDAKFEGVSRDVRDEILALFGVPASKLGLVEDVNRANADANDYTYQKETICPRLLMLEEKLNERIAPMYDTQLIIKFDNHVPEDKEYRLREREVNIRSGYSSIDDERIKDKEKPYNLPETKVPLIPFNLTPAGSPIPESTSIQDTTKTIEKKTKKNKWNTFILLTHPKEKHLAGIMFRYFEAQGKEVMNNLSKFKMLPDAKVKAGIEGHILFNEKEQIEKLKNLTKGLIHEAIVAGVGLGANDVNDSIDFTFFEPNIIRTLNSRIEFFATKVNDSTVTLLKDAIQTGIEQGESIDKIGQKIQGIYDFSSNFRSKRIAQTEVIGATNGGQMLAYQDLGVEHKEWLTAKDENVRDSHQLLDGKIIKATETFNTINGNRLLYPGDRSQGAGAEDVINCRCTINGIVKKENQ